MLHNIIIAVHRTFVPLSRYTVPPLVPCAPSSRASTGSPRVSPPEAADCVDTMLTLLALGDALGIYFAAVLAIPVLIVLMGICCCCYDRVSASNAADDERRGGS